jgi:hypothetical protein
MVLLYVVGLPISALIGIYNLRLNIEHYRFVTSTTSVAETINFEEKIDPKKYKKALLKTWGVSMQVIQGGM